MAAEGVRRFGGADRQHAIDPLDNALRGSRDLEPVEKPDNEYLSAGFEYLSAGFASIANKVGKRKRTAVAAALATVALASTACGASGGGTPDAGADPSSASTKTPAATRARTRESWPRVSPRR